MYHPDDIYYSYPVPLEAHSAPSETLSAPSGRFHNHELLAQSAAEEEVVGEEEEEEVENVVMGQEDAAKEVEEDDHMSVPADISAESPEESPEELQAGELRIGGYNLNRPEGFFQVRCSNEPEGGGEDIHRGGKGGRATLRAQRLKLFVNHMRAYTPP